jgi:predicted alpha/beta-fold hydrolase
MPLVPSTYKAPLFFRNAHTATIYPSMFRRVEDIGYTRERIITEDDDFLDLDWIKNGNNKLMLLSHGLEGNSTRPYILGAARKFLESDWDILAWNCRSCSGEMNRKPRFYHHGASEDLEAVVNHALLNNYKEIYLGGFSLGGSLTVKYFGTRPLPDQVKGGIVVSVPFSILDSVKQLTKRGNAFYRKRFLKKLKKKIRIKSNMFPDLISTDGLDDIQLFEDFDNRYTAPLHGFKDAYDFYEQASAGNYLENVKVPLLVINALNDPFLGDNCYPREIAKSSSNIFLEMPKMGGHVGFLKDFDRSWMDDRMAEFISEIE